MIQQKPKDLNPEKAEILGLLCAEGSYYKYMNTFTEWSKNRTKGRRRTQMKEGIHFNNNDHNLLEHFRKLMLKTYNYAPRVTGDPRSFKVKLVKKNVVFDLKQFTRYNCMKWRVPKEIINSDNKTKSAFIRGLYEGDGTKLQITTWNTHYIDFHMKNRLGLIQTKKILDSLGIESTLYKQYKDGMNRLIIKGIPNLIKFKNIIKPKYKKIDIAEIRGDCVNR